MCWLLTTFRIFFYKQIPQLFDLISERIEQDLDISSYIQLEEDHDYGKHLLFDVPKVLNLKTILKVSFGSITRPSTVEFRKIT